MKVVILNKEITLLRMFLLVVVLPIMKIIIGLFDFLSFAKSSFIKLKNSDEGKCMVMVIITTLLYLLIPVIFWMFIHFFL